MNENRSLGFSSFQLKTIAILCMLVDHIASVFQPYMGELYTPLRTIGRLSFPIFCFLIVEGFAHTSSRVCYGIRLGLFCVISEPCFDLAFHHTWLYDEKQNVFFTLLVGFLTIWAIDAIKNRFLEKKVFLCVKILLCSCVIAIACMMANWLMTDYSYRGILFICIFYLFRNRAWVGMSLFAGINLLCGYRISMIEEYGWQIAKPYVTNFLIQDAAILAILPMILYNGRKGRNMKWFFYLFYPVHLLLLYLIYTLI